MKDHPTVAGPGRDDASGLRVGLVVSAYHAEITDALRDGALAALTGAGARGNDVHLIPVPGAFEIPFAARRAAESGRFDALVCLGCVIRGETPHFDHIASAVAHGITIASQASGVPMTFGVLTTNTHAEAVARAQPGRSNKGREAALAAVQLTNVVRGLGERANGAGG